MTTTLAARSLPRLVLKPGKDRPLRLRHPWLFSGAIASVEGTPEAGSTVAVVSAEGEVLGMAGYNPDAQLCAKIWRFDDGPVDAAFFRERLNRAIRARQRCGLRMSDETTNAFRLVHAEADGLPGLIVDLYGDLLVVQVMSLAMEKMLPLVLDLLEELLQPRAIYERSDADVRTREGLAPRCGLLRGQEPSGMIEILESNQRFLVDFRTGQKTGFFLDQRLNRHIVAEFAQLAALELGRPLEMLNAFSYSGGFGIAVANAVSHVRITHLDASAEALALARSNHGLNGNLLDDQIQYEQGNAFEWLRGCRDRGRQFDLIVLDPPKFAASQSQADKAARGYKDLNLLALKLLRPGGLLATFSCSGAISAELFQKIVAGAALDAGRETQILTRLGPGPDHPVLTSFPEGDYLKGLLLSAQ